MAINGYGILKVPHLTTFSRWVCSGCDEAVPSGCFHTKTKFKKIKKNIHSHSIPLTLSAGNIHCHCHSIPLTSSSSYGEHKGTTLQVKGHLACKDFELVFRCARPSFYPHYLNEENIILQYVTRFADISTAHSLDIDIISGTIWRKTTTTQMPRWCLDTI